MSKTKIKIIQSEAKTKLDKQIEKGRALAVKAMDVLRGTRAHTSDRTRERDNYIVLFNKWQDFTTAELNQIFLSSNYSHEFKEKVSSKRKMVSSDWIPDVDYYLEHLLSPKIDYLSILRDSIDEFKFEKPAATKATIPQKQDRYLEFPERVTLSWLWRHVPFSFWVWLVGLLVSAFLIGISIGQLKIVQHLISQSK
jgi:hypothetical protein